MLQRLTIEDMREIANGRAGKCLSKKYIDSKTKLKWQCSEGHEWDAVPSSVKRGAWCGICARNKNGQNRRLGLDEMKKIAAERGGKCLSAEYVNAMTKLKWRCKEGHVWETTPTTIKNGNWCFKCGTKERGRKKRLGLDEMKRLAAKRGGKCLSTKYENSHAKLKWQCKEGHVWETAATTVKSGAWCPHCSRNVVEIDELHALAKRRGGRLLSEKYIVSSKPLLWECANGHQIKLDPNNVKAGKWCYKCYLMPFSYWDILNLIKQRKGECFEDRYMGIKYQYHWKCSCGHEWQSTYYRAKIIWCPECEKKLIFASKKCA